MKFSFLSALTKYTAVKGTTCLLGFPMPAVTQVWNVLDSFPGQLQHQMAQQSDSGASLLPCRLCFQHHISVRWVLTHLQHPRALWWSVVAPYITGDRPLGFRIHSQNPPFPTVHGVERKASLHVRVTSQGARLWGSAQADAVWWTRCFCRSQPSHCCLMLVNFCCFTFFHFAHLTLSNKHQHGMIHATAYLLIQELLPVAVA